MALTPFSTRGILFFMPKILNLIKNILGNDLTQKIRPVGHGLKGYIASYKAGFPTKKIKLIGITGTKGKTSTTILTGRLMNLAGIKTGYLSTALISNDGIRDNETLNPYKMTSIDAFAMYGELQKMVVNGCQYAVLEMSSEGLKQNRHWGLFGFVITVFLNIYPEHIESHGSFEKYKTAKSTLFKYLKPNGKIIVNGEAEMLENSNFMINAIPNAYQDTIQKIYLKQDLNYKILTEPKQMYKQIELENQRFETQALADFEITNFAFAYNILKVVEPGAANNILSNSNFCKKISGIPGRMEWVVKDNRLDFDN